MRNKSESPQLQRVSNHKPRFLVWCQKLLALFLVLTALSSPILNIFMVTSWWPSDDNDEGNITAATLTTTTAVVNITESPPRIFTCQNEHNGNNQFRNALQDVLPEYSMESLQNVGRGRFQGKELKDLRGKYVTHEYDLFQLTDGGVCTAIVEHWIRHHFRGKVVLFSGEDLDVKDDSHMPLLRDDFVYYLGPVPSDTFHPNALRIFYLQFVWWFELYKKGHDELLDHGKKPKSTKKHFLIYSQSNCVPFREAAYDEISKLGRVHHGGKCAGKVASENKTKIETGITLANWADNIQSYSEYRFCLVMEHSTHDGYVTEKILMAFQAGCVPIYYGTRNIFHLFNKDAFVFYDVHNATPALERVQMLESNPMEYEQVVNAPILAHGQDTIQEYFSFSKDVGGGMLKRRVRSLLGIDKFSFVT